jgi:hypothetical protein
MMRITGIKIEGGETGKGKRKGRAGNRGLGRNQAGTKKQ